MKPRSPDTTKVLRRRPLVESTSGYKVAEPKIVVKSRTEPVDPKARPAEAGGEDARRIHAALFEGTRLIPSTGEKKVERRPQPRYGKEMAGTERSFNALTHAQKTLRSRAKMVDRGGESLGMTVRPAAADALRSLVESGQYPTKVAAVEAALINEEKRLRRKIRRDAKKEPK